MRLGLIRQGAEIRRGPAVTGCRFVGGGYPKKQRFVEWARDEIDSHREAGFDRSGKTRASVTIGHAIPDLCCETRGNCNRRETLLTNQRPADRIPAIRVRFARRSEFPRRNGGHGRHERVEPLFLHTLQEKVLKSESSLKAPGCVEHR